MDEYNSAPVGFRQVTEKEFVQNSAYFTYSASKVQFRQMYVRSIEDPTTDPDSRKNGALIQGHLHFYHDGTSCMLERDYWAGKIRYWLFGCDHKYQDINWNECQKRGIYHAGRCYSVSECEKCGHINAVDSSD